MSLDAVLAGAALIGKALAFGGLTALLCLLAIGGVASLFEREEDAETLRRLAQRTRSDFVRNARWASPEDMGAEPDLITRDLWHRRN